MKKLIIALIAVVLLQSCSAYQKTSVSINEASNTGEVKVITTTGERYVFQNIELKDSIYYGVRRKNETLVIDTDSVSSIYLIKKEKKSPVAASLASFYTIGFGGGQFYNGQWRKGLIVVGISLASIIAYSNGFYGAIFAWPASWLYSIIDAPISAAQINKKIDQYSLAPKYEIYNIGGNTVHVAGLKLTINLN